MIVSHSKKFIFIATPKNASASLRKMLSVQVAPPLDFIADSTKDRHLKAVDVRQNVGLDTWNKYFTFAFVSNPYEHVVSRYCHLKRLNLFACLGKKGLREGLKQYFNCSTQFLTFEQFVEKKKHIWSCLQSCWCFDKQGNQIVSYIGRLESIEKDFETIKGKLALTVNFEKLNESKYRKKADFRSYYNDKTKKIVASTLKEDFLKLNYPI